MEAIGARLPTLSYGVGMARVVQGTAPMAPFDPEITVPVESTWTDSEAKGSGFHPRTADPGLRAADLCEQERWDELCQLLLEQADAAEDFEEWRRLCEEALGLAELCENPDAVRDAANARLFQASPANSDSFEQLEASLAQRAQSDRDAAEELIELYLTRIETSTSDAEKVSLLERIGSTFDSCLQDQTQAFDAWMMALELGGISPTTTEELLRGASQLARWPDLAKQAAARLRVAPTDVAGLRIRARFHRQRGEHEEQAKALSCAFNSATAEGDRKAILCDLADVYERHAKDIPLAVTFYERALSVDAAHPVALTALERIHRKSGAHRELASVLRRRLDATTDRDARAAIMIKLAPVLEERLADSDGAAALYREALGSADHRAQALAGLERVYEATQRWTDLLDVLEQALDLASTEDRTVECLMKLGQVHRLHFLRTDKAASLYEQTLALQPDNREALDALAGCYVVERKWSQLVDVRLRRLAVTGEPAARRAIARAAVTSCLDDAKDPERAMLLCVEWLGTADENLELVLKIAERHGEPSQAYDFLVRMLDQTVGATERVALEHESGRRATALGDVDAAEAHYGAAIAIDAGHTPSLTALRSLRTGRGDADRAIELLEAEQAQTADPRARAKLLVELAELRQSIGQTEAALANFEEALKCDGRQERAAWELFVDAVQREQWQRCCTFVDVVSSRLWSRTPSEQGWFRHQQSRALLALGDRKGARVALLAAHRAQPTDLEVLESLAGVCLELGDVKGALSHFQTLLGSLDSRDVATKARAYEQIAKIRRQEGKLKDANKELERALQCVGAQGSIIDALVEIADELGDAKRACRFAALRLDFTVEPDARIDVLIDVGRRTCRVTGDWKQAAPYFEEALGVDPRCARARLELLKLYQEASQWPQVLHTLARLARDEPDAKVRARHQFAIALVHRDELDDERAALKHFERSLDEDPSHVIGFKKIDEMLTERRDWSQLEEAYRRMILRVESSGERRLSHGLWHALGLIYRDRIGDAESALKAFRTARCLAPERLEERAIIAELLGKLGQQEEAMREWHAVLRSDPRNARALRALFRAYTERGDNDSAWCMASALSAIEQADDEHNAVLAAWQPDASQPRAALDDHQWRTRLYHQEQDWHLGMIFEVIAPAAIRAKAADLVSQGKLPNLPEHLRDQGHSPIAKTMLRGSTVLGVPCPALYVRPELSGTLTLTPGWPPATVAGRTALEQLTPGALDFVVGRHLASLRGELLLRALFPTTSELRVLLYGALAIALPGLQLPEAIREQVGATAQMLAAGMSASEVQRLRQLATRFQAAGGKSNVRAWAQAVEKTSARAGLLFSGDLRAARQIAMAEPRHAGNASVDDKLEDLLVFATSTEYLSLRRELGLTLRRRA